MRAELTARSAIDIAGIRRSAGCHSGVRSGRRAPWARTLCRNSPANPVPTIRVPAARPVGAAANALSYDPFGSQHGETLMRSGSRARRGQRGADSPSPVLVRFVLLSMLLHVTIVVLFGTSHGGGAGRGEAALDVLDVTLRRLAVPDAGLRSSPGIESNAGRDLLRRPDQRKPVPAPIEPPTTIQGPAAARPVPLPPHEQPYEAVPPPAVEPLPRVDLRAPQEVDKPLAPPLIVPPAMERLQLPTIPPPLVAPAEITPPPAPLAPAAPTERLTAPAAQRDSHRRSGLPRAWPRRFPRRRSNGWRRHLRLPSWPHPPSWHRALRRSFRSRWSDCLRRG